MIQIGTETIGGNASAITPIIAVTIEMPNKKAQILTPRAQALRNCFIKYCALSTTGSGLGLRRGDSDFAVVRPSFTFYRNLLYSKHL